LGRKLIGISHVLVLGLPIDSFGASDEVVLVGPILAEIAVRAIVSIVLVIKNQN
jgi:hypothetical protein